MITTEYKIEQLDKLLNLYTFPTPESRHTANLTKSYYRFSYFQMMSFRENTMEFFKKDPVTNEEIGFYLDKSWAHAYAMYALLRTTLEAMEILRKMLGEKDIIHSSEREGVKKVIDIANDIVKHPTFKYNGISTGTEPISLQIGGFIEVEITSHNGRRVIKEINPNEDFRVIKDYLASAGEKLIKKSFPS